MLITALSWWSSGLPIMALYGGWVSIMIKVFWRVTQQGAVPIMTINLVAPFTGTADPSIPMRGVDTRVILEASMPMFVIALVDRMFIELPLSTSILWTLCPSIIMENTKASLCGYLIPCPSTGVNVMSLCQNFSWPIVTRSWSPNLVLLLLATPTLVDEPSQYDKDLWEHWSLLSRFVSLPF